MKCKNKDCDNEGTMDRDSTKGNFTVLNVENSKSTWDDWDQDITLRCNKCGHEFHDIW